MKNHTITVAGNDLPYLLISTLLLQRQKVCAVDVVPEKVELINNRKPPIQDEYFESIWLQRNWI